MHFSTDLITKRDAGLSTVWQAGIFHGTDKATRSFRIPKKDFQSVNIPSACDKIMKPDAPLSLRFSAILLCGIATTLKMQHLYLAQKAGAVKKQAALSRTQMAQQVTLDLEPDLNFDPKSLLREQNTHVDPMMLVPKGGEPQVLRRLEEQSRLPMAATSAPNGMSSSGASEQFMPYPHSSTVPGDSPSNQIEIEDNDSKPLQLDIDPNGRLKGWIHDDGTYEIIKQDGLFPSEISQPDEASWPLEDKVPAQGQVPIQGQVPTQGQENPTASGSNEVPTPMSRNERRWINRKVKKKKAFQIDHEAELPKGAEKKWFKGYIPAMLERRERKIEEERAKEERARKKEAEAKREAYTRDFLSNTLFSGLPIDTRDRSHPLVQKFSGPTFLSNQGCGPKAAMTNSNGTQTDSQLRARSFSEAFPEDMREQGRNVRHRDSAVQTEAMTLVDQAEPEMGMGDGHSQLPDHHSSAIMPGSRQGSVIPVSVCSGSQEQQHTNIIESIEVESNLSQFSNNANGNNHTANGNDNNANGNDNNANDNDNNANGNDNSANGNDDFDGSDNESDRSDVPAGF